MPISALRGILYASALRTKKDAGWRRAYPLEEIPTDGLVQFGPLRRRSVFRFCIVEIWCHAGKAAREVAWSVASILIARGYARTA